MMMLTQIGYPNTVACLGGNFSPVHQWQLDKYFSTIIIMTDFDDKESHKYIGCRKCAAKGLKSCRGHNPGRALGETISERLSNKKVLWASYDHKVVYPHGAKDVCNMTDEENRQCLKNAVSNFEYHQWGIGA
jgi:5S rRNA maturation endonuclease (ribonuclease M5)